ncbi:cell division protein FtsQ/DivIB [Catalinimonas niigatensis]|uniref:cell division protein FtsQ/DivIB n=1 Tax=Catalinimonas niigatensis TaxID=1397264 RepID=UPI0026666C90|nr:cell division protein FtsQ [Catalinimonas niigatensis]WPP53174.1 cell division protein FtsQ [Catalinimonas niigatensis]
MKLKKWVKIVIFSLSMVSIIAMTEKHRSEKVCQHVMIHVDNRYENYFIDEQDVQMLMTDAGADNIVGKKYLEIDLKALENRIETNKYVHRAEVHRDVKGNLLVYTEQNRPMARVMRSDAPDAYISDEGEILPVSDKYTARVMLISGEYTGKLLRQKIKESEEGQQIFELINFINRDEFWKAQIVQMEIASNGNILLYPQVGKQLIEFGKAEKISEKFNKLAIFYEQVLPRKGWNYYTRVNLKYQDQIVCD